MSEIDLTLVPWNRLAKLAPPNTTNDDLQAAAERHATHTDVYAAAADLWEEAAMRIDLSPDCTTSEGGQPAGNITKVSQDGISVEYADSPLIGNGMSARIAQHGQMMSKVRQLRARAKVKSPLVHDPEYNPWRNRSRFEDDCERIIVVEE